VEEEFCEVRFQLAKSSRNSRTPLEFIRNSLACALLTALEAARERRAMDEQAAARDENAVAKCSEATLHGTYLFAYDGVQIRGNNKGPFAAAGYQAHDGNHKVHGVYSANFNGEITHNEHYSGTYTVEADCTGTAMFTDGSHYDLFIAPDGSKFTFVQTRPKRYVTSGTAQRVGH
jgi:hypothetical protein